MRIVGTVIAAASLLSATAAGAQQSRPLPAFTVASSAGAAVPSDRLNAAERWLLVYVAPDAVACDRLLRSLDAWVGADAARIVVIVAGRSGAIDTSIRPLLPVSSAVLAVYADPDGSAARALALTSIPALVGIEHGEINWNVQGVLNDPGMVDPLVRTWFARP